MVCHPLIAIQDTGLESRLCAICLSRIVVILCVRPVRNETRETITRRVFSQTCVYGYFNKTWSKKKILNLSYVYFTYLPTSSWRLRFIRVVGTQVFQLLTNAKRVDVFFVGFNKEKYNIFSVQPHYCYTMSSSYIKLLSGVRSNGICEWSENIREKSLPKKKYDMSDTSDTSRKNLC